MLTRLHPSIPLGVVLAALLAVLVTPAPAFACTCGNPPPPEEALADADAVFSGEVIATWHEDWVLTARFEVDQVWKGDLDEWVDIVTPLDGAACGYWLDEGHTMLVYAYLDRDEALSTSVCTRTVSLERAEETDIGALGPGSLPVGTTAGTEEGEQRPEARRAADGPRAAEPAARTGLSAAWWWMAAAGMFLVAAVGAGVRRAGRR